jgi:hypothetical protein
MCFLNFNVKFWRVRIDFKCKTTINQLCQLKLRNGTRGVPVYLKLSSISSVLNDSVDARCYRCAKKKSMEA